MNVHQLQDLVDALHYSFHAERLAKRLGIEIESRLFEGIVYASQGQYRVGIIYDPERHTNENAFRKSVVAVAASIWQDLPPDIETRYYNLNRSAAERLWKNLRFDFLNFAFWIFASVIFAWLFLGTVLAHPFMRHDDPRTLRDRFDEIADEWYYMVSYTNLSRRCMKILLG